MPQEVNKGLNGKLIFKKIYTIRYLIIYFNKTNDNNNYILINIKICSQQSKQCNCID